MIKPLLFICLLVVACRQKTATPILTQGQKDSAIAVAQRYFKQRFGPDYKYGRIDVIPASYRSYWELQGIMKICPGQENNISELMERSTDDQSLILVMGFPLEYNEATTRFDTAKYGTHDAFIDTTYRVLRYDCDSGLVFKRF